REGGAERQQGCHPDRGARQAARRHGVDVRAAVLEEISARRRVGPRRGEGVDRPVAAVCGLIGLLAAPASAQEVVLHEYVRPPAAAAGRIVSTPAAAPEGKQPPVNPTAIRQDDKLLVAPHLAQPAAPSEVVHGQRGFAADRETEARPDYATQ